MSSLHADPSQPALPFAASDMPAPAADVAEYLCLTREVMPAMARERGNRWPVRLDHCFQRIVLDTVAGGVWYDHIPRPAARNLSTAQAARAVALCRAIIAGQADLDALNRQSLAWRGKLRRKTNAA